MFSLCSVMARVIEPVANDLMANLDWHFAAIFFLKWLTIRSLVWLSCCLVPLFVHELDLFSQTKGVRCCMAGLWSVLPRVEASLLPEGPA